MCRQCVTPLIIFLIMHSFFSSRVAWAETIYSVSVTLKGRVITLDDKGVELPLSAVQLAVVTHNINTLSDANGRFTLKMPSSFSIGDKVLLSAKKQGYMLLSPYQGKTYLPKNWNSEAIQVCMISNPLERSALVEASSNTRAVELSTAPKRGLIIQALSVADKDKAEEFITQLKSQHESLAVGYEFIKGKVDSYRVVLGPFSSMDAANAMKDKLVIANQLPKDSFVRISQ